MVSIMTWVLQMRFSQNLGQINTTLIKYIWNPYLDEPISNQCPHNYGTFCSRSCNFTDMVKALPDTHETTGVTEKSSSKS